MGLLAVDLTEEPLRSWLEDRKIEAGVRHSDCAVTAVTNVQQSQRPTVRPKKLCALDLKNCTYAAECATGAQRLLQVAIPSGASCTTRQLLFVTQITYQEASRRKDPRVKNTQSSGSLKQQAE